MANVKTIVKKLVNAGFSEDKLMMMTEKEIRETFKSLKEEESMKNHANEVETINSATTVEKEETTMNSKILELAAQKLNATKMYNFDAQGLQGYLIDLTKMGISIENDYSAMCTQRDIDNAIKEATKEINALNKKEEITMRELMNSTINRIMTATKVQDAEYVTRDELAGIMEQLTGVRPGKKVTRKQMVQDLYILEDDLQQMENANGSDCDSDTVVAVGDFCHDHAPESIESDPTPVVDNPVPVSDAKAKTVEVLKLIKDAAVTNHNKGFGTTVSAYMLCAYILQAGYGIKKLKGHEAEITDEQKDTVKRVRQWLIDKGYIKACVYKTNGKSVYTDDYDGNHAASMIHYSKSQGLTCVGVSSYKITF